MDAEERGLFTKAVADAVAGRTGAALDAALDQLGWADALEADAPTAVGVLFEEQGRAGAVSGALQRVVGDALGEDALGPPAVPVVLPPLGRTAPAGRADGDEVAVRGLLSGRTADDAADAHELLVVVAQADGTARLQRCTGLALVPVHGLDPDLGMVEVSGTCPRSARSAATDAWDDVVAAGQRALAHELVGASRAMLELARQHALERIQFGVPIASFQAVRHRLADAYVAIEAAASVAEAAAEHPDPLLSAAAKAVTGRSARLVAKHCQQVLAGIGFTTEHPFHRYLRRTRLLDGLLGDARSLTRAQGEVFLRAGALPPNLPLSTDTSGGS